ncbi:MAG: hypothetical protein NC079_02690 [Clostridium sp.]|nr:hypothetical protein [Acetatifactor muris]MCM1527178.1 hypothetical protein [Bacteroides sp.]MCM1562497.1 hypothetical protein [Clostridium sp.]
MLIQTEYEFILPKGYVDARGRAHRRGVMRCATALDEIEAGRHPGTRENGEFLAVVLLSKVVRIEGVEVSADLIGKLTATDFAYLQNLYETVNRAEDPVIRVQCPHCGKTFNDTLNFAQGE